MEERREWQGESRNSTAIRGIRDSPFLCVEFSLQVIFFLPLKPAFLPSRSLPSGSGFENYPLSQTSLPSPVRVPEPLSFTMPLSTLFEREREGEGEGERTYLKKGVLLFPTVIPWFSHSSTALVLHFHLLQPFLPFSNQLSLILSSFSLSNSFHLHSFLSIFIPSFLSLTISNSRRSSPIPSEQLERKLKFTEWSMKLLQDLVDWEVGSREWDEVPFLMMRAIIKKEKEANRKRLTRVNKFTHQNFLMWH